MRQQVCLTHSVLNDLQKANKIHRSVQAKNLQPGSMGLAYFKALSVQLTAPLLLNYSLLVHTTMRIMRSTELLVTSWPFSS